MGREPGAGANLRESGSCEDLGRNSSQLKPRRTARAGRRVSTVKSVDIFSFADWFFFGKLIEHILDAREFMRFVEKIIGAELHAALSVKGNRVIGEDDDESAWLAVASKVAQHAETCALEQLQVED